MLTFASSDGGARVRESSGTKSGYLYKRTSGKGISMQKYKKRWFVVRDSGMIVYAHNPTDLQKDGGHELDLQDYNISFATDQKADNSYPFKATRPGQRTYYFRPEPDSNQGRADWMQAFSDAACKRTGTSSRGSSFSGGSAGGAKSPLSQQQLQALQEDGSHGAAAAGAPPAIALSAADAELAALDALVQTPVPVAAAAAPASPPPPPVPASPPAPVSNDFACNEASLAGAAIHGWLERMEPGGAWGKLYYVLTSAADGGKLFRFNNPQGQIPLGYSDVKFAAIDFVFDDDPIVDGKERVVSIHVKGEREKMYLSSHDDDDFGLWFSTLNNVAQT